MSNTEGSGPEVLRAAESIREWLRRYPGAAETKRGIVEWWLMQQRFEDSWRMVERALDLLVDEGAVTVRILPNGDALYVGTAPEPDD